MFRFYGERELFESLNWPQIELIRSSRLIFRWHASKITDALAAVYIALPWWVYGHIFERIVKRITDGTPREFSPEQDSKKFLGSGQPNDLLNWIGISSA